MYSRFDIVLGHYVYNLLHHEGQWSDKYARLCKITCYFSPGRLFSEEEFLNNTKEEDLLAKEVYDNLVERNKNEN